MLMNRIIGAFTFRREVYADVEADTSFTTTAYILVAVVAVLNALGAGAAGFRQSMMNGVFGVLGTAVFALIGFVVGAWVISWVGKNLMGAEVDYGQIIRTLGLAYVWNVFGALGVAGAITPLLSCVTGPVVFIGWILGLIAWFVALKEALDLGWGMTILTAIIGWIAMMVIVFIGGFILGAVGIVAGTTLGLLGL